MRFADKLKTIRKQAGMSQEQLAGGENWRIKTGSNKMGNGCGHS